MIRHLAKISARTALDLRRRWNPSARRERECTPRSELAANFRKVQIYVVYKISFIVIGYRTLLCRRIVVSCSEEEYRNERINFGRTLRGVAAL